MARPPTSLPTTIMVASCAVSQEGRQPCAQTQVPYCCKTQQAVSQEGRQPSAQTQVLTVKASKGPTNTGSVRIVHGSNTRVRSSRNKPHRLGSASAMYTAVPLHRVKRQLLQRQLVKRMRVGMYKKHKTRAKMLFCPNTDLHQVRSGHT